MPILDIDGCRLNYESDGEGPNIVFINGLTMDTNGWVLQVPYFSKKYRVLRYDCRGQGKSDKPDMVYTPDIQMEDLKNILDELEVERAHIIGLSYGGMIAQHFAVNYPKRVGALVLVDTCSYIGPLLELTIKLWIKATEVGGNELRYDAMIPFLFSENFIENNLEKILSLREASVKNNPSQAVINLAKGCLAHNIHDKISNIVSPTLIVVGEEDILIPLKYSRLLHERIKDSELLVIEKCGHAPPLERPEEFNSSVMTFLEKHDHLID